MTFMAAVLSLRPFHCARQLRRKVSSLLTATCALDMRQVPGIG